jgi:hypothetical protein
VPLSVTNLPVALSNKFYRAKITVALVSTAMIIIFIFEALCVKHHYKIFRTFGYLEAARPALSLLCRVLGMTLLVFSVLMWAFHVLIGAQENSD